MGLPANRKTPEDYVPGSASPPKVRQPGTFARPQLAEDIHVATDKVGATDGEVFQDDGSPD